MAEMPRYDRFDLFALMFGGVFALLFVLNLRYYPTELDTSYHLLIGDILSRHGPLFRTDAMEFAPYGRYMGYPPLLHWIIASMRHAFRLEPMDIGRALAVFQGLALLAGTWFVSRRFFGPCAAFAALVFVTSVSELWWWQTSVAPVSLAYAFFWPGMLLFFDKKWKSTALWLASCFYLHLGMPYVVLLCLIVFGVMMAGRDRSYLTAAIWVPAASVILALPEFWYFSRGLLSSISPTSAKSMAPSLLSPVSWGAVAPGFNLFFWSFVAVGAWVLLARSGPPDREKERRFVTSCVVVFAPYSLLFFGGTRFHAQFPVVGAVVAGVGFSAIARRVATPMRHGNLSALVLAILLCAALSFGERAYVRDHTIGFELAPLGNHISSLKNAVPFSGKHPYRIQDFFWRQDMAAVLDYIRSNIDEGEILHMSNGAVACYVTLETGRRTDWGMFWESLPQDVFDKIENTRTAGYFVFRNDPYEIRALFRRHPEVYGHFKEDAVAIGSFRVLHVPKPPSSPHLP